MPAWTTVQYFFLSPAVLNVGADSFAVICCHLLVNLVYGTNSSSSVFGQVIFEWNFIFSFFRLAGHCQKFGHSNISLCLKKSFQVCSHCDKRSKARGHGCPSGPLGACREELEVICDWRQGEVMTVYSSACGRSCVTCLSCCSSTTTALPSSWGRLTHSAGTQPDRSPTSARWRSGVIEIHNDVTGSPGNCYQANHWLWWCWCPQEQRCTAAAAGWQRPLL